MALNASEAIKTAFGSLKTDVGQKLIGLFFVIQLVNIGSTVLTNMGMTALQIAGVVLGLVAALASIAATIGGLRSYRKDEVERSLFTDNLLWPFIRTLGANLTSAAFAYLLGLIFLLPAYIAVLGGVSSLAATGSIASGLGTAGIALAAVGGILGFAVFSYVIVTLLLAQPLIAIEDKRMFQSLDESVQRTKGSRLSIFLAGLGTFLVYGIVALLLGVIGNIAGGEQAAAYAVQLLVVPIFTPVFLALLNHFTEELPLE
ncbi:hypothetical protein [Candidatus Nanohalovita haloferacivicina]|uniref:hypothetical protein n=1 Tax=Candidatus Nanohalovita haloferacivicina TaxID=2978046 RepID=UPI00325FBC4F|nr:hypothetical protein HBNXNv_0090 [Candidatus Nanohalobia archaeon BNXNv]